MKTLILIFFIILNSFIYSDDSQHFSNANESYNEKDFNKALELYNLIEKKDPNCWFNIGNCFFKLNKFENAIAAWKKSLRNNSKQNMIDIELNIAKAKEKLNNHVQDKTIFDDFYNFFTKYLSMISIFSLQILFLVLWYLIFLFSFTLLKKRYHLLTLVLLFSTFGILTCLAIKYNEQNKNIVLKETEIYAGPSKEYHSIGLLKIADEVKICDKKNEWVKISNNEKTGWVFNDSIFEL